MDRIVMSMTNHMRSCADVGSVAVGTAFRIRWSWAAFPVDLLILSVGFLLSTVIVTYKRVQSSRLAAPLYGLDDNSCQTTTANRFDRLRRIQKPL